MEKYLRRILNIIDDNKHKMRDGDYIEMCNNFLFIGYGDITSFEALGFPNFI